MISALSGRDIEAVNKTVSGLTDFLFPPDPEFASKQSKQLFCMHFVCSNRRCIRSILFIRSKSQ